MNKYVGLIFICLNLMLYPAVCDADSYVKLFKIDKKTEEKVKECIRFRLVYKTSGRI